MGWAIPGTGFGPGEPGKAPGDVNVLIVGQPERGAVDASLSGLETQLGRQVNVTCLTSQRWADASDPFVATVCSRPLVALNLGQAQAEMTAS